MKKGVRGVCASLFLLLLALMISCEQQITDQDGAKSDLKTTKGGHTLTVDDPYWTALWDEAYFKAEFPTFIGWLREKKYSEAVVRAYERDAKDADLQRLLLFHFMMRNREKKVQYQWNGLKGSRIFRMYNPIPLVFYELVPEDEYSSECRVGPENAAEFAEYLTARFGKRFVATYHAVNVSFKDYFGGLIFERFGILKSPEFKQLINDKKMFNQTNAIYVFYISATMLDGRHLHVMIDNFDSDMPEAGVVYSRINDGGPCWDVAGDFMRTQYYDDMAEEIGHSFGLIHQYFEGEKRNEVVKSMTLPGIMGHADKRKSGFGVWVSPLTRYALEPFGGYDDDPSKASPGFGEVYNQKMAWRLDQNR